MTSPSYADALWNPIRWAVQSKPFLSETAIDTPLRRRKPTRYLVNSVGDMFSENVPDEWIDRIFAVMALCPQHTFMVLTAYPERMREYLAPYDQRRSDALGSLVIKMGYEGTLEGLPWPLPNVFLGATIHDQSTADARIPLLLDTPAAVRFVSASPLLGAVDLSKLRQYNPQGAPWIDSLRGLVTHGDHLARSPNECSLNTRTAIPGELPAIDWIIVGGQSGPGSWPCHPDWLRALRDQCVEAGTSFWFDGWGDWQIASYENGHTGGRMPDSGKQYTWLGHDGRTANPSAHGLDEPYAMARVGKRRSGRLLDGEEWSQVPEARNG